jgi:hypothetical protein
MQIILTNLNTGVSDLLCEAVRRNNQIQIKVNLQLKESDFPSGGGFCLSVFLAQVEKDIGLVNDIVETDGMVVWFKQRNVARKFVQSGIILSAIEHLNEFLSAWMQSQDSLHDKVTLLSGWYQRLHQSYLSGHINFSSYEVELQRISEAILALIKEIDRSMGS